MQADVYGWGDDMRVLIQPNPINERLDFPAQVERLATIYKSYERRELYIEDTGYQRVIIQQLTREGVYAKPMSAGTMDKRARLALGSSLLERGQILFPREGAEQLISQLTGFGSERHDDLADAFSITLRGVMEISGYSKPSPVKLGGTPWRGPDGETYDSPLFSLKNLDKL